MLRVEDCLPGTEIVCIKYEGKLSPRPLKVGAEYSIKEFFPKGTIITTGFFKGQGMPENSISLNEIPLNDENDDWAYMIEWFKLKYDPKALEIFKFKGINVDQPEKEDA